MSFISSASFNSKNRGYDYYQQKKLIQTRKINHHEFEGIADFAVIVGRGLDDRFAQADIGMVIHAGGPKAQDIRAVLGGEFVRIDAVSGAFGHFGPLFVHDPAMGYATPEGWDAIDGHGDDEGTIEPTAVLVGSF